MIDFKIWRHIDMKRLIRQSENLNIYRCINEPENLSIIQDMVDQVTEQGKEVDFWGLKYVDDISDKISRIICNNDEVYDKIYDYFLYKYDIDLEDDYEYQQEVIKSIYNTAYEIIDWGYIGDLI